MMPPSSMSTIDLPEKEADPPGADGAGGRDGRPRALMEVRPGARLGRYTLLEPLGRGGMAEVWIGTHTGPLGFRRLVAIKTIRPDRADDLSTRKMFLDEARIAARLRHSNVVEVLDLGELGELVYQVMPLVEGDSLSGLVRRSEER